MTKIPFLGLCKKRLSKDIGPVKSKRLVINNIEYNIKTFLHMKQYYLSFYLTPSYKFRTFCFSINKKIVSQKGSSLGRRIWYLKKICKGPIVLFGSDIPNIRLSYIEHMFYILKHKDIAIAPTFDGGFWAIGFSNKRPISFPFTEVSWSSKKTLSDLLSNLRSLKISYSTAQKLRDIDIFKDYCNYVLRFRQ